MSSVITYVEIFSNIAFGGSLLVNTFFIYIVYSKTKRDIGSYKYLMIWFAVINILYSFAEFISKPTIFIYGHSYIAYSKGYMTDYQQQGFLCLCFFIAMYGMNTAVLSLQFIYRYLFVCRSNLAFLIEEKRYIFMWIMSVLAWGTTYGLITYVCFPPTREYYRFARNYIRSELELSVEEMTFFCVFVYATIPFLLSYTPRFILFGYLFAGYSGIRLGNYIRYIVTECIVEQQQLLLGESEAKCEQGGKAKPAQLISCGILCDARRPGFQPEGEVQCTLIGDVVPSRSPGALLRLAETIVAGNKTRRRESRAAAFFSYGDRLVIACKVHIVS
ncbi:unnamed protein product [Heligmosomoides polygyrus]|uniref:G protein-coupled receptor n=1 Tax=Heligmosomoides polygyrus TaxID=6339 RepID=A0A3P7ZD00_HELPZ|nr:unnamed protein product [Heligmosomoides polygyrus]